MHRADAKSAATAADGGRRRTRTHFGFESVPLAEKQELVDDVFHTVARRYDLMNDLMSAGLHRAWKDALVTSLKPPKRRPFRHLDVAGGTGDVAFRVLDAGGPMTHVTVLDINGDMLAVGRERAGARLRGPDRLRRGERRGAAVPRHGVRRLHDRLRHPQRAAHRGGAGRGASRAAGRAARFLCLEFSQVDVPGLDALYDAYSFNVIPRLGRMVAGDAELLPLSRRVRSAASRSPAAFAAHDRGGGLPARDPPPVHRRHRRAPLGLEDLTSC